MTRVEIGDIYNEDQKHKIIDTSVTLRFSLITPVEEKGKMVASNHCKHCGEWNELDSDLCLICSKKSN